MGLKDIEAQGGNVTKWQRLIYEDGKGAKVWGDVLKSPNVFNAIAVPWRYFNLETACRCYALINTFEKSNDGA